MTAAALSDDAKKALATLSAAGGRLSRSKVAEYAAKYEMAWDVALAEQKGIGPGDRVVFIEGAERDDEPCIAKVIHPGWQQALGLQELCPWYRLLRVYAPHYPEEGFVRGGHIGSMIPVTPVAWEEAKKAGGLVVKGSSAWSECAAFVGVFVRTEKGN